MKTTASSPRFSVVIATYNRAGTIERSVRSVLDGALQDIEVIVVDDGSTDETATVLGGIADDRLVVIYQENRGRTAARNRGANEARAQYLTFLDSDDYAEPLWLERLATCFDSDGGVGIACCGCTQRWLDQSGVEIRRHQDEPKDLGPVLLGEKGLFLTGTFAVRRNLFDKIGGYNETMARGETTELALRLVPALKAENMTIACVPDPLIHYEQRRPPMMRRDHQVRLRDAETMLEIHGQTYYERSSNRRASYFAIAGASAAYLGDLAAARRHFAAAVRDDPKHLRGYARLALSWLPPAAKRVWVEARS